MYQKRNLWAAVYLLLLAGYTVYVLLSTFVIKTVYSVVSENALENPTESAADAVPAATAKTAVITENQYDDGNIRITLSTFREYDSTIYAADVVLKSAGYLKTAFAKGVYGRNITESTSVQAEKANAILAVNGDYYGSQQKGYVLRNGVIYRSTADRNQVDLVISESGRFSFITEGEISTEALLLQGARQILSFGPSLLRNGEITVSRNTEVAQAMASNPRTAIAEISDLHYLFLVSDGRTQESEGLTLYQLANVLKELGAKNAYNLDGGGSSTLYFNGKVINTPTTTGRNVSERKVSDIVYIGYE